MKQLNKQNLQIKLRNKFLKLGIKMLGPETIYFSEDTKLGNFMSGCKIGKNLGNMRDFIWK